ncbi:MAG: 3-oxoacyl-[acyl-carrier-protein] reductase [Bryobacteraceae bacterium]|nr:3-oxoacyl-[acyl-carrier-protein] reductase [Bryobacteraceae bacterium]
MKQRIALVTGASRGIGRACALALSAAGCRVVLAARDEEKLREVESEVIAEGGLASHVILDLSSEDSIREAFAQTAKDIGPVEILVNNAGITRDGLALRLKREDWNAVIETNLTGSFFCIQQVLHPMMRARWGRIINISSVVGQSGNAGQANYSASKAGLIGLTKSLAQEMGSRGITVNAVAPGFVATDMTSALSDELKTRLLGSIPLKRLGEPGDIAEAVRFLASEGAGYITGHVLDVNGGLYM